MKNDSEDGKLYDELGNYIGPGLAPELKYNTLGDNEIHLPNQISENIAVEGNPNTSPQKNTNTGIVLHSEKQYYQESEDVFPDAEIILHEEDAQSLSEAIIAPAQEKTFLTKKIKLPESLYSHAFHMKLSENPKLIRNICLLGHLHHGKTTFADYLVNATLEQDIKDISEKPVRWLDTRQDEQDLGMSIKAAPMSVVLPDMNGKSYVVNVMDVPGHPNFAGEVSAGLRMSDGAILLIDVVEGLQLNTRLHLRYALQEKGYLLSETGNARKGLCLVFTKFDRLILELKLPPKDAYIKLQYLLHEINLELDKILQNLNIKSSFRFSPEHNNVLFSSGEHGWCFSIKSFGKKYCSGSLAEKSFVRNLWGDMSYSKVTKKFVKTEDRANLSTELESPFIHFILEPIYKLYSLVVGEEPKALIKALSEINIHLTLVEAKKNVKTLLKIVFPRFFEKNFCFVDMLIDCIPSALEAMPKTLQELYEGKSTDYLHKLDYSSHENLIAQITKVSALKLAKKKFFDTEQDTKNKFLCLCKIFCGTLRVNDEIMLVKDNGNDSLRDEQSMTKIVVKKIYLPLGRHNLPVSHISYGNWAFIEGIDNHISGSASALSSSLEGKLGVWPLKKLQNLATSIVRLAIEPLNASELPQLIEGLRCVSKSYPSCETKVEENGEHYILGTGELFLDCVMRDLRELYTDIEIKVADPSVCFRETIVNTSALPCSATTSNSKNSLTFVAEPLESGLAEAIESNSLPYTLSQTEGLSKYLETEFSWDVFASRRVWAFGPEESVGMSNVLINDVLETDIPDISALDSVKDPIIQGFNWSTREGPLCDEPVRSIKFKLTNANLASKKSQRNFAQIIPSTRHGLYSSILTADPKMMEPINFVEVISTPDVIKGVDLLLNKRRGNLVKTVAIPATPFYLLKCTLPVIESFGFETDLRIHTSGEAFALQVFDHWNIVPGDPLDSTIVLQPLEPARPVELARDFMIKTRRRKGLGENVTVSKFFDSAMIRDVQDDNELRTLLRL